MTVTVRLRRFIDAIEPARAAHSKSEVRGKAL